MEQDANRTDLLELIGLVDVGSRVQQEANHFLVAATAGLQQARLQ